MSNFCSFLCIFMYRKVCEHARNNKNVCVNDDSYHNWYFHKTWSCFSGVHTLSHSYICLQKAWIILKFEIFVNKVNFMPFCFYGNAMKLKNYYVFLTVSYISLHIHQNNFYNLNLKFMSNFRPKTALNAPTPLFFQLQCIAFSDRWWRRSEMDK